MTEIMAKDYYGKNSYGGCSYGEKPLVQIQNLENADKRYILVIRNSFVSCVISGLALCEQQVDVLDLRLFSGSVQSYAEQDMLDLVISLYSVSAIDGDLNKHTHKEMFDFC